MELIGKYSSAGVLVDSNLLLLLCVGILDQTRVSQEKGVREYTSQDYEILREFLSKFARLVTTPNVVTELSNLSGRFRYDFRIVFRRFVRETLVSKLAEQYVPSARASTHFAFDRLGITDATIGVLAEEKILVVTSDLDLSITLASRKLDHILFRRDLADPTL
jgi:hypothetical protein